VSFFISAAYWRRLIVSRTVDGATPTRRAMGCLAIYRPLDGVPTLIALCY
jgi:hypothetical protein